MNHYYEAEASRNLSGLEGMEGWKAQDRIQWAWEQFGEGVVMSTSFGIQSAVLLHMVKGIIPSIPVVFVDTGYLFEETYRFAEQLRERLDLNLKVYSARRTAARQEALEGKRWAGDLKELEAYNLENKVEPMNRALVELQAKAWITGLRRVQSRSREGLKAVEQQKRTIKIHPIIDWSEKAVYDYLLANELPFHPLWKEGYASVGDWHSSAPLQAGQTAEETRFKGLKRECGLHESSSQSDWQI
ncbi:MAG: hypothetical protein RL648_1179 [Verrucomicrobiota bacterium]